MQQPYCRYNITNVPESYNNYVTKQYEYNISSGSGNILICGCLLTSIIQDATCSTRYLVYGLEMTSLLLSEDLTMQKGEKDGRSVPRRLNDLFSLLSFHK